MNIEMPKMEGDAVEDISEKIKQIKATEEWARLDRHVDDAKLLQKLRKEVEEGISNEYVKIFTELDKLGTVMGSKKEFKAGELVEIIREIRKANLRSPSPELVDIAKITHTGGLRDKIRKLVELEKEFYRA